MALWTPAELGSAVKGWWDAAEAGTITLSGSQITAWASRVGSISANQNTGVVTYSATARNGLPGAVMPGNANLVLSALTGFPTGSNEGRIIVVGYNAAGTYSAAFAYGNGVNGGDRIIQKAGATLGGRYASGDATIDIRGTGLGDGVSWNLDDVIFIGRVGPGNILGAKANGTTEATAVETVNTGSTFGYIGNVSFTFNGVIQEILVIDGSMTSGDIMRLEGYLAHKWSLSAKLPVDHPYKSAAPTINFWTPEELGSVVKGWWDAQETSTITESGGAVSSWASRVNGITANQATEAAKPTYSATARNSLPGVTGDGGDFLALSAFTDFPIGSNEVRLVLVGHTTGNNYQNAIGYGAGATQSHKIIVGGSPFAGNVVGSSAFFNINSGVLWQGNDRISIADFSGGFGGIKVDGGSRFSGSGASTTITGTVGGLFGVDVASFPGTIQEALIIAGAMSSDDIARLEGYLAHKWGLTANLPVDHPYKYLEPEVVILSTPGRRFRFNIRRWLAIIALATDALAYEDTMWTWFNDPRAIAMSGRAAIGGITSTGRLRIYDSADPFFPIDPRGAVFDQDDHANPSMIVRASDSRILVAACAHNGTGMYTYLSTNPNDVSAFDAEVNIDSQLGGSDYSYTYLYQLEGLPGQPIYLFFRNFDNFWYSVSTDDGVTWSARIQLLTGDGANANWAPYVKITKNGSSRLDFFCTDGNPEASTTNSIYHFYFDGTNFRKTNGTILALPVLPSTGLTPKVYDGTTNRAWIWDAAVDGSGNPVCVFHVQITTDDYRYYWAKWNGASWDVQLIVAGGGNIGNAYYSGGVALDPDDINVVFCAIGPTGGDHQIWRYVTANGGASWSGEQFTFDGDCFRPYVIRGLVAEPRLTYIRATSYASFTNYLSDVVLRDSTAAADVHSDAISFTAVTDAAATTLYTSNAVVLAGLGVGVSVPVRVSGGEWRKNDGAWGTATGTAVNGDTFEVRQTSAATNYTLTRVALLVGARVAKFDVTTGVVASEPAVFLPDFTGVDGATTATDLSTNAIPMTFGGNAQIDTGNPNYASGALLLDGTGDYVDMADHEAWNIGASTGGAFTIDVDFELASLTNLDNTTGQVIIGQNGSLPNYSWTLWPVSNNMRFWWWTSSNGGGNVNLEGAWTPALLTLYRVRVVSDGALVALFLNGTRIATQTYSAPANASGTCRIGARSNGGTTSNFNGWIGGIRVVKNEAKTDPNDLSYTPEPLPFT